MNVHFIVNPASGGGLGRTMWPRLEPELTKCFAEHHVVYTERRGHATVLASEALAHGASLVVAVGGDGTINEVVNGFFDGGRPVNPDAEFGMINLGTGSDFARTIRFSTDIVDFLKPLCVARSEPCDLGRCTFTTPDGATQERYFINIADLGIGGEVARKKAAVEKWRLGRLGYLWTTFSTMLAYRNIPAEIAIDDHPPIATNMFSVIVANGKYFGGDMLISPYSEIYDGYFDVIVIGDVGTFKKIFTMRKVYQGRHLDLKEVGFFRAKKITVRTTRPALLDCDGEQPGQTPATFEVIPHAIRIKGRARIHERIPQELPVRYAIYEKSLARDATHVGMTRDLSTNGISFVATERAYVGDKIEIKYNLPCSLETIVARGEVIKADALGDGKWNVSLQIVDIGRKNRALLKEYLERVKTEAR